MGGGDGRGEEGTGTEGAAYDAELPLGTTTLLALLWLYAESRLVLLVVSGGRGVPGLEGLFGKAGGRATSTAGPAAAPSHSLV